MKKWCLQITQLFMWARMCLALFLLIRHTGTNPPSLTTSSKSNIFYNVLISDCLQHLIVLSQLLQLLINILYIWKSFLYHCPLTRRIITHSVIKQSAKTWPCALSAKNHGISRRLNVVDIMIVTFFYIIRVLKPSWSKISKEVLKSFRT